MMTQDEYEFLTDSWTGPKGAAYNQVYEFCREFGWMKGMFNNKPLLSKKGIEAVKAYQANENFKKIESI